MPSLLRQAWRRHRDNAAAVAAVFGIPLAILGLVVGYLQLHSQIASQASDRAAELAARTRSQAELISGALLSERGGGGKSLDEGSPPVATRVGLYNRSGAPAYDAVVRLVAAASRGTPADTVESFYLRRLCESTRAISVIPPGEWEIALPIQWSPVQHQPRVELAFVDAAKRDWVRHADGQLVRIHEQPIQYLHLAPRAPESVPTPLIQGPTPRTLSSQLSHAAPALRAAECRAFSDR